MPETAETEPKTEPVTEPEPKAEPETVPTARLKAEIDKTTAAEERAKVAEEKADMAMGQVRLAQANPPAPAKPQKGFVEGIMDKHFPDPEDTVVSKEQMANCLNDLTTHFGSVISNMQVMQNSPNYSEVVTKYFPNVVKNDSVMAQMFQSLQAISPAHATKFAYTLSIQTPEYKKDHTKVEAPEVTAANEAAKEAAAAALKAAEQPGSASAVGGAGAIDLTAQVNELSKDPEAWDKATDNFIRTGKFET